MVSSCNEDGLVDEIVRDRWQVPANLAMVAAHLLAHLVLRRCLNDGNLHTPDPTPPSPVDRTASGAVENREELLDCGECFEMKAFKGLIKFDLSESDAQAVLKTEGPLVLRSSLLKRVCRW